MSLDMLICRPDIHRRPGHCCGDSAPPKSAGMVRTGLCRSHGDAGGLLLERRDMGYFINPTDMSKERWLMQKGKPWVGRLSPYKDWMTVCLVENPGWTAAGIMYSRDELKRATLPQDQRPKAWFLVPKEDLRPYLPKRLGGVLPDK